MRQKVVTVGDVVSIEDCYNASPDSMKAALTTLKSINANKKIAVLADMLELGDYSFEAHSSVGALAGEMKIDYLLAYGEHARAYVSSANQNGLQNAFHFDSKQSLCDMLLEITQSGDAVLFKGSRGMRLEEVISCVYKRWEK